jgi:hypothetical protein
VDGVPSQQTSASFTITGPGLSAQGWLWEQSPVVSVHVTSAQGAATQILIDGAPAEPIFSLDGDGLFLLTPGQHDIAARYTDASGRFGPSTHLRVTIDPWL